ncbi:MAG: DUF2807 domain-containing protein [Flavobacteriaceae bacterium]|nr:DUF2807 domain-containing protein [Candidatus Onthonaster equi]
MKHIFLSLLLVSTLGFSSCNIDVNGMRNSFSKEVVNVSQNNIDEIRKVNSFNGVDVRHAIVLNVTDSPYNGEITINAPDNVLDKIKTEVVNGVLKIYVDGNLRMNNQKITVNIPHQKLRSFNLSGAVKGTIQPTLKVENLTIDLSGASSLQLKAMSNKIVVNNSGASSLVLDGNTQELVADISGASKLNAESLKIANATIDCSGASSARVWVIDKMTVDASGASKVLYKMASNLQTKLNSSGASKISSF